MNITDQGYVNTEIENGIARIEFFHPSHNSLPTPILQKLRDEILRTGASEEVKLIIISSGGERTFCAGASFDELVAIENETTGKSFFMGFANVINAIRTCGKIVIGRVQGKAVGGGVGLASAFDYCLATKFASVRLSELAVGIGPFVIGPAVQRKVGLSAFSQMAIDPKGWYTAEWSRAKGLYAEVFESAEEMDTRLTAFAEDLCTMNPEALNKLKQVFWEGTDSWETLLADRAKVSGKLVLSDFSKKTIQAFLKS